MDALYEARDILGSEFIYIKSPFALLNAEQKDKYICSLIGRLTNRKSEADAEAAKLKKCQKEAMEQYFKIEPRLDKTLEGFHGSYYITSIVVENMPFENK